jgi:hypothetical protein
MIQIVCLIFFFSRIKAWQAEGIPLRISLKEDMTVYESTKYKFRNLDNFEQFT